MRTRRGKGLAGAACTALLGVAMATGAAAPAGAAPDVPKLKKATFKVSVKGWQKYDWKHAKESTGPCDPSDHSYGGEYATFRSLKSTTIKVFKVGKGSPNFLFPGDEPVIQAKANIARNAVNAVGDTGPECGSNGGGVEPTPPDCGLREISPYPLSFGYDYTQKDLLTLTTYGSVDDPYNNCGPGPMPYLIEEDPIAGTIGSQLPHAELFDRKIGKLIVIGHGEDNLPQLDGSSYRTEVHWELTLVRQGKKKK